ncbi:unnamed protein product, partial [Prorocentrum cordatum]
ESNKRIGYRSVQWADFIIQEKISMQMANGVADGTIGTGRAARDTDYTEYQLPRRNGMITVSMSTIDVASFPIFIPPRGMAVNQSELSKWGRNSLPIISGDYNCAFGIRRHTTEKKNIEATESSGTEEPALENTTSPQRSDLKDDNHLAIGDAFMGTGNAYYGSAYTSNLDHVALPAKAMCRARQPYPEACLARRLQLHNPAHLTDHMLIYMNLDVHSAKTHNSKLTPHANYDLMMITSTRGYK